MKLRTSDYISVRYNFTNPEVVMTIDYIRTAHATISVEMSNPFPSVGVASINKFKEFSMMTSRFVKDALSKIETNHKNGLLVIDNAVQTNLEKKVVVFTDLAPIGVYTPPTLKENVTMLDYAESLVNEVKLALDLMRYITDESSRIITVYAMNPSRLQDPTGVTVPTEPGTDTTTLMHRLESQKTTTGKLIKATGVKSNRKFSEAYKRINDLLLVRRLAIEINNGYNELAAGINKFTADVDQANGKVQDLLAKIERDPDYKTCSEAAGQLMRVVYNMAVGVEYVGATTYNAQVFIKAVTDTFTALSESMK